MKKSLANWCKETNNMHLLKEWDYEKNGDLKPESVSFRSAKKISWKCSHGHEWKALVCNRTRARGCPYCANKIVAKGENDLQTLFPDIAKEWHPTKNGELTPSDVVAGSDKKVWWKCSEGHEWEATICNRTVNGTGCLQCFRKRLVKSKSI